MRAVVQDAYGPPDVLRLEDVPTPVPARGQVLVRVYAAGVNPADCFITTGSPLLMRLAFGLFKPKHRIRGQDFAGVVQAVGDEVSQFEPGDAVYGSAELAQGAFAETIAVDAPLVAPKPENLSFEQAAAVPMAGLTALHALRDTAQVREGQSVLINGAAGGVGSFAVQIAKARGATVTAVCSGKNVERVRALGADHVIDYTKQDFTSSGPYDVLLDNVANHPLTRLLAAVTPRGVLIPNNGSKGGRILGPLVRLLGALLLNLFVRRRIKPFVSVTNGADLQVLKEMCESSKLRPLIDRTVPLEEAAVALAHVSQGHASGKVVLQVRAGSP